MNKKAEQPSPKRPGPTVISWSQKVKTAINKILCTLKGASSFYLV